jgi:hypothetical protein
MDFARPYAKVYASHCVLEAGDFIKAFHGWIQNKRIDEMLIDVADYSHVHHGPGVLLVSHEGYYGMDQGEGRIGMKYRRRLYDAGPAGDGLRQALRAALAACALLEEEFGERVRFDGAELLLGFDDRLHAPNDADTFGRLEPEREALATTLFDSASVRIAPAYAEPNADPRAPFRARMASDGAADVATLSARLT